MTERGSHLAVLAAHVDSNLRRSVEPCQHLDILDVSLDVFPLYRSRELAEFMPLPDKPTCRAFYPTSGVGLQSLSSTSWLFPRLRVATIRRSTKPRWR